MLRNTPRWLPNALAGLVLLAFAAGCLYRVHRIVRAPERAERLVANDSQHYLEIARSFSAGDFSMSYVKERAHRQPLYPLLLTPVMLAAPENLYLLAAVNVVVGTLVLAAAYLTIATLFRRRWLALVLTVVLAANQFLIDHSTERLLTEALHVLLMLGVLFCFLQYLREQTTRWLVLTVLCAGLDYLTRPNGLFVTAGALAVLGLADLRGILRSAPMLRRRQVTVVISRYALALAVLILVTLPSWLPRAVYNGNPLHHAYLNNYLWVDSYQEAHRAENFARYTWRDYVATHDIGDAATRWLHGLNRVVVEIPPGIEGLPVLYLLTVAGCLVALVAGPAPFRYLLLFFILQLLPLIWTNLPNPSPRIPYGSMLPFEVFFAGYLMVGGGALAAHEGPRLRTVPNPSVRTPRMTRTTERTVPIDPSIPAVGAALADEVCAAGEQSAPVSVLSVVFGPMLANGGDGPELAPVLTRPHPSPGIEQVEVETAEVPGVAGDDSELMHGGGRCDEPVHDRQ